MMRNRVPLDELDGPVAAPGHHKVLFENDEVRVLETTIRAGDVTPLHTHLTPTLLVVQSGSHFLRRAEDGSVLLDTRADPAFSLPRVSFSPPTPRHTLENTGADDLVVIGVELKHLAGRLTAVRSSGGRRGARRRPRSRPTPAIWIRRSRSPNASTDTTAAIAPNCDDVTAATAIPSRAPNA